MRWNGPDGWFDGYTLTSDDVGCVLGELDASPDEIANLLAEREVHGVLVLDGHQASIDKTDGTEYKLAIGRAQ